MARIAGVNIPQNKVVHVALTYIHGVGKKFSDDICTKLNIAKDHFTPFSQNKDVQNISKITVKEKPDIELTTNHETVEEKKKFLKS